MGVIRNAVKSFDPAPQVASEQKALLAALDTLASTKLQQMKAEINEMLLGAGSGTNLTIPVVAIEAQDGQTHASTSDGLNKNITDTVTSATSSFLQGGAQNIVSGIMSIVSTALEAFLGSGSAQSDTLEKYYVAYSGVALWRVDLRAWYYSVEGSGISTQVQRVSAYWYVRSTVDVEKLKFQTFLNEYESIAAQANPQPDPDKLLEEINNLRKLYNALAGRTTNRLSAPIF
ncbi:MAG: hypothetical protein AB7H71_11535 [Alphaproteobacteria bacterium]